MGAFESAFDRSSSSGVRAYGRVRRGSDGGGAMDKKSSAAHARGQWFGTFAAVLMAAASAPGVVSAHGRRITAPGTPREAMRRAPVVVAMGALSGDSHARDLLNRALADAIAQEPALRFQSGTTAGASIVVNANIRALTVQNDALGPLARCDIGIVVSDSTGAVRAMIDARRTVRGTGDSLEENVLRGAANGVVRDLVAQMVR
jgi:hypothetical protein